VALEPAYGEKKPDMFNRPLVLPLIFFAGGILTGRFYLFTGNSLLVLILLITSFLIISLYLSNIQRLFCFLIVFFGTGILLVNSMEEPTDLLHLSNGKKIVIEGTVVSPARTNNNISRFELEAEKLFIDDHVKYVNDKILVTVYNRTDVFPIGTRIRFPAYLKPFINFNNPGSYDYELSMRLKMISCNASVSDGRYIVPMGEGDPGPVLSIVEHLRRPVRDFLNHKLSPRDSSLFKALILGEREGITKELREPFNITGMGHVLAVSGLHVGIIAWLSFMFIQWVLTRSELLTLKFNLKKISALITCVPVVIYTGLAGFQVSGQRAMIMILAYLMSIILGREKEIWSTLALSALFILALDPMVIQSISFQLTFLAVTGIVWLTPFFQNIIPDPFKEDSKNKRIEKIWLYLTGMIAASLSAVIFLMPVTVYYFHRVSTVTVLANLIAIPLMAFIILPAGLIASFSLIFSSFVAEVILGFGVFGIHLMMRVIDFFAGLSWSSFLMVTPGIWEILMIYSLLFCLFSVKKWQWMKYILVLVILVTVTDISYWLYQTQFNNKLRVTFIDVGQGNAALVQFPGNKKMLIDGGGFRVGSFDTGENVVTPFLLNRKILKVDYLVLSHPHPDHMNGLRFIASEFNPSEFWYNGDSVDTRDFTELMGIVKTKSIKFLGPEELARGRTISGVEVEVLYPLEGLVLYENNDNRIINNNSLVLRFNYEGKSILFTGDIEQDAEAYMAEQYGNKLKSDVLLVPHHGSRYSSSNSFLEKVKPDLSIISSRKGNRFGFPHMETLERLKRAESKVLRIDMKGAIEVTIGENLFDVQCWDRTKLD